MKKALAPLASFGATATTLEASFDRDHGPFMVVGVPAMTLWVEPGTYDERHHTVIDTFDGVDPRWLAVDTAVMAILAWELANAPGTGRPAPLSDGGRGAPEELRRRGHQAHGLRRLAALTARGRESRAARQDRKGEPLDGMTANSRSWKRRSRPGATRGRESSTSSGTSRKRTSGTDRRPESRTVAELARHIIESGLLMSGELSREDGDFRRKSYEALLREHGRGVSRLATRRALLDGARAKSPRRRARSPEGGGAAHPAVHPALRREAGDAPRLDAARDRPRGVSSRPTGAVRATAGAGAGPDATDLRRLTMKDPDPVFDCRCGGDGRRGRARPGPDQGVADVHDPGPGAPAPQGGQCPVRVR